MNSVKIIANGKYLPKNKIDNKYLTKELGIEEEYIYKRTGIQTRFYSEKEEIEDIAIKSVENLIQNNPNININETQMIVVATTSTDMLMPGISYKVQEKLGINKCICLDILAGCAGYINAFDLARNYIAMKKVDQALIIGVDILSKYINKQDIGTTIILGDGAGATLIKKTEEPKMYQSIIESNGLKGDILTNNKNEKIKMKGKEVYKYAVTETIKNIEELLKVSKMDLDKVKYIVPHQSNLKIIKSIANKLNIDIDKIYINIKNVGNTFCGSIPIALAEMFEKGLLQEGDKIILIGYGGGLNTGSILIEI